MEWRPRVRDGTAGWPPQLQYRSMCGVQTQRLTPIAFDLCSLHHAYPQIRVCSDCSVVMGLQETLTILVLLFLSLCLFICCFLSLSLSVYGEGVSAQVQGHPLVEQQERQ